MKCTIIGRIEDYRARLWIRCHSPLSSATSTKAITAREALPGQLALPKVTIGDSTSFNARIYQQA